MGASFTIYSSILNDKKGLKNGETTYLLHQLRSLLPVSTESTSFLNFVLAAQISQRREKTLERACDPSSHSLWCWKSGRAPENSWLLLLAFAFTFEPSHFFLLSNFFSLRVVNQQQVYLPNPPCTRIDLLKAQSGPSASWFSPLVRTIVIEAKSRPLSSIWGVQLASKISTWDSLLRRIELVWWCPSLLFLCHRMRLDPRKLFLAYWSTGNRGPLFDRSFDSWLGFDHYFHRISASLGLSLLLPATALRNWRPYSPHSAVPSTWRWKSSLWT